MSPRTGVPVPTGPPGGPRAHSQVAGEVVCQDVRASVSQPVAFGAQQFPVWGPSICEGGDGGWTSVGSTARGRMQRVHLRRVLKPRLP